ncbi:MAG: hypothetical protein HY321_20270 [Armatimonadetes bacterium]|nr:hypothetical protein [Armatimonadota bacterium]
MYPPRSRLLTAVLVCLLSVVAVRADAQHTHHWYAYSAPEFYGPTVSAEYVRKATTAAPQYVGLYWGIYQDYDMCSLDGIAEDPECPAPFYGFATNDAKPVAWSDNGAGGTFGKLVGSTFTALGSGVSADEVDTYRLPTTPCAIQIQMQVDDFQPTTEDPNVSSYNDGAVWSDPVEFTVWEFTIDNPVGSWVPALNASRTFTAEIRPLTDHASNSMARVITFRITPCSQEEGYCLNANRNEGDDYDTEGNDLKFIPALNEDLDVTSTDAPAGRHYDQAATPGSETDATATVTCLDYGAYGEVSALAVLFDAEYTNAHVEGALANSSVQMPTDVLPAAQGQQPAGNHIADASSHDGSGAAGNEDDDDPEGDGTPGDRLSRYEEYRGLKVNASWTQLDPTRKDVFIRNVHGLDASALTTENLGAPVHYMQATEVDDYRAINFKYSTYHLGAQTAIRIINGEYNNNGDWGASHAIGRSVPNNEDFCKVYVDLINADAGPPSPRLDGGIGSSDTTIQVDDTYDYQNTTEHGVGGHFKIDSEVVAYTNKSATQFTGCSRGQGGTTAASHADEAKVTWFAYPNYQIRSTFAHEAGHLMELEHMPDFWETGGWHNIMNLSLLAGATVGNGDWHVFRDAGRGEDALEDEFCVVP